MGTITKTPPTFSNIEPLGIISNQSMGTVRELDLTTKVGATLLVWIGRRAGTTPSRAGYLQVRNSDNKTAVFPSRRFDVDNQGPTTAAAATTLTANANSGTNTLAVNANTGFAVGDTVCLSESSGARLQFNRIVGIGGTGNLTFTLERALTVNALSGDALTNLADAIPRYLPGGDIYEIRATNYSGLDLVFRAEAIIDNGEIVNQ